jgi:thymidylate synthase
MFLRSDTLDDLLRRAFDKILRGGMDVEASRGQTRELCAVLLRLTNPLARLSHTETKGKLFSALGELAWYLSGSKQADFVTYYIKRYKHDTEPDGTIHGAYGPRAFRPEGASQFDNVMALLRERPTSRKAVIQLFDGDDLKGDYKDVPCTCTLQFFVRSGRLDMAVAMRSNDAYFGLSHDVFAFTMIQEIAARTLGYELGHYSHFAGSLHIYQPYFSDAKQFLDEGWQDSLVAAMPPMPPGDPWPNIRLFLEAEEAIRSGRQPGKRHMAKLPEYWQDLVRLLQVFTLSKSKRDRRSDIAAIMKGMANPVYKEFIAQRAKPKKTAPKSGQPLLFNAGADEEGGVEGGL